MAGSDGPLGRCWGTRNTLMPQGFWHGPQPLEMASAVHN